MLRYTKQDFVDALAGNDRIAKVKVVQKSLAKRNVCLDVKRRKVNGRDKFYFTFVGLDLNNSPVTNAMMIALMKKYFPDASMYRVKLDRRLWKEW